MRQRADHTFHFDWVVDVAVAQRKLERELLVNLRVGLRGAEEARDLGVLVEQSLVNDFGRVVEVALVDVELQRGVVVEVVRRVGGRVGRGLYIGRLSCVIRYAHLKKGLDFRQRDGGSDCPSAAQAKLMTLWVLK